MKTNLLYLLGLLLATVAFVAARSAVQHHWDWLELAIAAGFLAGSVAVLRKAGRTMDSTKPPTGAGG
ncbi:hypothetical protein AB0942_33280 [Streptomyces nodosus]|uniref:hypothetical protein n=1 Tax=Streptomyces nodosus TaxID=40318 RepID=UPI003455B165